MVLLAFPAHVRSMSGRVNVPCFALCRASDLSFDFTGVCVHMGVDFIGNLTELQPGEFLTFSPNDRSVGGRYQEMMGILGQGKGQTSGSGVTRVGLGKRRAVCGCMLGSVEENV